jgi:radical SAM protein with 4Fe4S-binding SPASM domain
MNPASTVDTEQRPLVLVWEVTQACDLACDHCRADAQPDRHPDELTEAEGRQLLESAADFGEGQLVVLSGGDPLYRDDLFDLIRYGTDQGLRMTVTPSGTGSLDGDTVDALADAGIRRIALSIDGAAPDTHDAFRGEPGGFERTVRAARCATAADIPLQINTTVCASTVDELPAVADLVADLDAVLWSVFFLVPVGRGAALDEVSPERAEAVMEWLVELRTRADFMIKTTEAPHLRRVAAQRSAQDGSIPSTSGRRSGITAGDGFAFVSHTGDVFPSGFLPESGGNVREDDLVDLYRNAELFERLRDRDALRGKCGVCEFRYACGGSRSRAFAVTGDPLASDPLCAYTPEAFDEQLPRTEHAP